MDKHLKMTLEHTDLPLYCERYQLYTTMHILSFMSPAHAMLYNEVVNHQHWFNCPDDEAQLAIMRFCTPKTKYNRYRVWENFVKKPKQEKVTKLTKYEDWLMTVYEIPRKTAQLYLEDEKVLEEVKERMK